MGIRQRVDVAGHLLPKLGFGVVEFDVFLAPSAPGEAPEGLGATGDPVFQVPWTTVGAPCITIPYATGPKGLPVGVQLIGRRGDDDTVLAVAKWFDARR